MAVPNAQTLLWQLGSIGCLGRYVPNRKRLQSCDILRYHNLFNFLVNITQTGTLRLEFNFIIIYMILLCLLNFLHFFYTILNYVSFDYSTKLVFVK